MGKAVHKDNILKKVTYPAFFGLQESKRLAQSLIAEATLHLQIFDKRADPLRELAKYILKRSN
jgi:geranylgeranyl diphosphate synthase type II